MLHRTLGMGEPSGHAGFSSFLCYILFGFGLGSIISIMLVVEFGTEHISPLRIHDKLKPFMHTFFGEQEETLSSSAKRPMPGPLSMDTTNITSKIFVGVLSHPRNMRRREHFREKCVPILQDAARERGLHVVIKFVMGRAAEAGFQRGSKIQGRQADASVVALGKELLAEERKNGDVFPVAMVDQYIDIMDKVIALFRHGLQLKASLIAKVDDDTCGNVTGAVWDRWVRLQMPEYYYFGYHKFEGTEYDIMYGVDNRTAPYMSGPFYGLSHNLSRLIFKREYVRATQHHVYATSSEDNAVGRLVKYVEQKYLIQRNQSVCYESDVSTLAYHNYKGRR